MDSSHQLLLCDWGKPRWHLMRLSRMSLSEVFRRSLDAARKRGWRHRRATRFDPGVASHPSAASVQLQMPRETKRAVSNAAEIDVLSTADTLLDGKWHLFGEIVEGMTADIDWFRDPHTGRRGADHLYCFDVPYRDENRVGNVKFLWEISRHQYLTVLATAYWLSRRPAYAERVAADLRSWWRANPFLIGVHWSSGIELALRLISWVWIRRLLADWPGTAELFERNTEFVSQLHHHQEFLAAFSSYGSSANNHLIAEAAGQFCASVAFPLFDSSRKWERKSARVIEREVVRQTDSQGLNRELATAYHGFVLELLLAAGAEADNAGRSFSAGFWTRVQEMMDALASVVDCNGRPPRQGDSDDGFGLLVDGSGFDRWASLLATGARIFGRPAWWPTAGQRDVRAAFLSAIVRERRTLASRPRQRIAAFEEAGLVILRDQPDGQPELWCRCDHGPLGYLSIAAHAHADALAIELRHGGIDVLADPGTYCYHGEAIWRRYFRSTLGHNTLELGGRDQARNGGPFLWLQHPRARLTTMAEEARQAIWSAAHDGYRRTLGVVVHRTVRMIRGEGSIIIEDWIEGRDAQDARLPLHLGPTISCRLHGSFALLEWQVSAQLFQGTIRLPQELAWRAHVGDDVAGWYSAAFAQKRPTTTLIGYGRLAPGARLATSLTIRAAEAVAPRQALAHSCPDEIPQLAR